jgi:CrcB protein
MQNVYHILIVAFGSALGGLARWGMTQGINRLCGIAFPWATLAINLIGCLVLGIVAGYLSGRIMHHPDWFPAASRLRLLLAVGFAGSFTTFSTFELETHALLEGNRWPWAAAYVLGSVLVGLVAMHGGLLLGHAIAR